MKKLYIILALAYIVSFATVSIIAFITGHGILAIITASYALYKAGFGKWLLNKFTISE